MSNISTVILFDNLYNTRDLGGIKGKYGTIKSKRILRSGTLFGASESDINRLTTEYELKTVVDFRTPDEASEKPDPEILGVKYLKNPILDTIEIGVTYDKKSIKSLQDFKELDPLKMMPFFYRQLADYPFSVEAFKTFLWTVKDHKEGAILYHCSAGKDRVGSGTALILSILGVPKDDIIEDYMLTNACMAKNPNSMEKRLAKLNMSQEDIERFKLYETVRPELIESFLGRIDKLYGNVDNFISDVVGFGTAERDEFINNYII